MFYLVPLCSEERTGCQREYISNWKKFLMSFWVKFLLIEQLFFSGLKLLEWKKIKIKKSIVLRLNLTQKSTLLSEWVYFVLLVIMGSDMSLPLADFVSLPFLPIATGLYVDHYRWWHTVLVQVFLTPTLWEWAGIWTFYVLIGNCQVEYYEFSCEVFCAHSVSTVICIGFFALGDGVLKITNGCHW